MKGDIKLVQTQRLCSETSSQTGWIYGQGHGVYGPGPVLIHTPSSKGTGTQLI